MTADREVPGWDAQRERLRRSLRRRPEPGPPFPCPYLPGREARHQTLLASTCPPGLYTGLMDLNFRRLGPLVYRPVCDGCSECRQLRVPVTTFRPSRSQRRCLARNRDLAITIGPPHLTDEKLDLYARYLHERHDGQMTGSREELKGFLYVSGTETLEVCYREGPRLVAVGIADAEPRCLSAVYCYYEPTMSARGLGTFNVLWLLGEARRRRADHLYLGYFVAGAPTMEYKAGFRPCELLRADGSWEPRLS
ncbi:MAG TPA: arginyltransferase [Vicinamibacteria bacterium]|nr:arginyltransferase [Vicinamibacteria bacterium]